MLDFADLPYRYFPPRRNALIAWALTCYNRWGRLPGTLKVDAVEVSGLDALREAARPDDHLMLVPNHPTHADAAIVLDAARQAAIVPQFMAAYDVFLRSRLDAFVMQRLGAFSVDREGSDKQAMKQAAASLLEGRFALTIFPEGNVYLQNDLVTPFHDGAAFLAVRAAKELAERGRRLLVVPVSIKATHVEDVSVQAMGLMKRLADWLACDVDLIGPPLEVLRQLGRNALQKNLKQRGISFDEMDDLPALITHAADRVLSDLEDKIGITPKEDESLMERVRSVRRLIHDARCDENRVAEHTIAATWADEAMLALRIASYSGTYVAERPTVDRFVETLVKLAEDVTGKMQPPQGKCRALVRFCEPIDVNAFAADHKSRAAIRALTTTMEITVQSGVDRLNASNPHPGGEPWHPLDQRVHRRDPPTHDGTLPPPA